jgi:hypothetical protein
MALRSIKLENDFALHEVSGWNQATFANDVGAWSHHDACFQSTLKKIKRRWQCFRKN